MGVIRLFEVLRFRLWTFFDYGFRLAAAPLFRKRGSTEQMSVLVPSFLRNWLTQSSNVKHNRLWFSVVLARTLSVLLFACCQNLDLCVESKHLGPGHFDESFVVNSLGGERYAAYFSEVPHVGLFLSPEFLLVECVKLQTFFEQLGLELVLSGYFSRAHLFLPLFQFLQFLLKDVLCVLSPLLFSDNAIGQLLNLSLQDLDPVL